MVDLVRSGGLSGTGVSLLLQLPSVRISTILGALESSDKMLLYGVSKHLIGRLTRKPCRSLYGDLRHKAYGQLEHFMLPWMT